MGALDIILVALLLIGTYFGYTKGFLMELVNTGSFILGIVLALKFWYIGAAYVQEQYKGLPHVIPVLGFILIFVVVLVGLRLVGRVVKAGLSGTLIGSLDKLLGAMLGCIKWVIGVCTFLWVVSRYPILNLTQIINKSVICSALLKCMYKVVAFF